MFTNDLAMSIWWLCSLCLVGNAISTPANADIAALKVVKVEIATKDFGEGAAKRKLAKDVEAVAGDLLEVVLEQQRGVGKIWTKTVHDKQQFEMVYDPESEENKGEQRRQKTWRFRVMSAGKLEFECASTDRAYVDQVILNVTLKASPAR